MNPKGTQNKNRAIRPPTFPFGNFEMLGTFPMRVSYLYKLVPISYKLNSKHVKPTGIGKCSTLFTSPNYCGFLVSNRYSWVEVNKKSPTVGTCSNLCDTHLSFNASFSPAKKNVNTWISCDSGMFQLWLMTPNPWDDTRPGSRKISPKRPGKLQPAMVYQGIMVEDHPVLSHETIWSYHGHRVWWSEGKSMNMALYNILPQTSPSALRIRPC